MSSKPKIHELAIRASSHYQSAADYFEAFNSDIPKAIAYYYCDMIISAIIKNKNNWETILCEKDIEYLYANGTPKQIKIMSFYIDASRDKCSPAST